MGSIARLATRAVEGPKRLAQRAAAGFGLYVGRHPLPNTLQNRLRYVLGQLGINCVIDVGAHYGEYGQMLRRLGYKGRIVSFEPIGDSCAKLTKAAKGDGAWKTFQLALGAEEASLEINVLAASDLSSFLPVSYRGTRFGDGLQFERKEQVSVRPLSAVFQDCTDGIADPRVLLKMDTQGYDFAVLDGARSVMRSIIAVQSEVAARPIYDGMPLLADALARYHELGLDIAGIFPVSSESDNLRVIEFDCLLVR